MGFNCAREGQVGAQGVVGPEAQEARVLFCYLAVISIYSAFCAGELRTVDAIVCVWWRSAS